MQQVPINPRLPANFDNCPNDERPESHQIWWDVPYIVSESVGQRDAWYAARNDECADDQRTWWASTGRAQWLKSWPGGCSYSVRCLDGGAWDRSTCWGIFGSLDEALARAGNHGNACYLGALELLREYLSLNGDYATSKPPEAWVDRVRELVEGAK